MGRGLIHGLQLQHQFSLMDGWLGQRVSCLQQNHALTHCDSRPLKDHHFVGWWRPRAPEAKFRSPTSSARRCSEPVVMQQRYRRAGTALASVNIPIAAGSTYNVSPPWSSNLGPTCGGARPAGSGQKRSLANGQRCPSRQSARSCSRWMLLLSPAPFLGRTDGGHFTVDELAATNETIYTAAT